MCPFPPIALPSPLPAPHFAWQKRSHADVFSLPAQAKTNPRPTQNSLPDPAKEVKHEDFDQEEADFVYYPPEAADIVDAAEIKEVVREIENDVAHEHSLTWKPKTKSKNQFKKEPK